jgi:hypothetical protein
MLAKVARGAEEIGPSNNFGSRHQQEAVLALEETGLP